MTYVMTPDETAGWESTDDRERDAARRAIRAKARAAGAREIETCDRVTMDYLDPAPSE